MNLAETHPNLDDRVLKGRTTVEYGDEFYIGREYDSEAKEPVEKLILYNPDNLTTHGVVVGMTGSGIRHGIGRGVPRIHRAVLPRIPPGAADPARRRPMRIGSGHP